MLNPQVLLDTISRSLKPIQQWLDDPSVTEIMVNPGGHVFVESRGVMTSHGVLLDSAAIERTVVSVGKFVDKNPIPQTPSAIVYASIDDMRFAGALAGVSPSGAFLCIRKHRDKDQRHTMPELVDMGMLTGRQAALIEDLVISKRKNLVIVGGTSTGKTTLLNALLDRLPQHERIQTIEDSREIQIKVPNYVPLLANPDKGITARALVKMALRTRPDRLILGETRGDETFDPIRALNSGHPGSITTCHADSALLGLSAIETMVKMSEEAASMDQVTLREFIASSVNLVVFINRSTTLVDGQEKVVRKVQEICSIKGVKDGKYDLEYVG